MAKSCYLFKPKGDLFLDEYVINEGNTCVFDKGGNKHTFITREIEKDIYFVNFGYNTGSSIRLYNIIVNIYDKTYYYDNINAITYLLEIFDGIFMFPESSVERAHSIYYYKNLFEEHELIM